MMTPLDYGRSFLIGTDPNNQVRLWVESRTRIIDENTGKEEDYHQFGSCKSENTFAPKDLFHKDNYDFMLIFGPEHSVIFRRKAYLNPNYTQYINTAELFGGPEYHLVEAQEYEEIKTNQEIFDAAHTFMPIVGQTEIWNPQTKLRAIIEYPVKSLNNNIQDDIYQVDTGPVALPDLAKTCDRHIERIALAYVAFNVPEFADFVIEAPTVIRENGDQGKEICKIHHYSKIISLETKNRLFLLKV